MLDRGSVAKLVRAKIEAMIVQQAKVHAKNEARTVQQAKVYAETKKPWQLKLLGPFLVYALRF